MSRVGEGMLITEYLGQGLIFHRGEREREEEREREGEGGRERELISRCRFVGCEVERGAQGVVI